MYAVHCTVYNDHCVQCTQWSLYTVHWVYTISFYLSFYYYLWQVIFYIFLFIFLYIFIIVYYVQIRIFLHFLSQRSLDFFYNFFFHFNHKYCFLSNISLSSLMYIYVILIISYLWCLYSILLNISIYIYILLFMSSFYCFWYHTIYIQPI